jgi:hypothetical protein
MAVRVIGVFIGMHWGLLGIAWAYVVGGYGCLLYPTWSSAGQLIGVRFGELLRNVTGPFVCAVVMATLVWLSDHMVLFQEANWLRLFVGVMTGSVIYGILIRHFQLQAWDDVRTLILDLGGQHSRFVCWLIGANRYSK